MNARLLIAALFATSIASAAPKVPDPPADFVPLPDPPPPSSCGPWEPGNGDVDRAAAAALEQAAMAYEHWKDYSDWGSPAAARYDAEAMRLERVAQWSVAVWATSGRWALLGTPLRSLSTCLGKKTRTYKGEPMDCAELEDRFKQLGRGIWVHVSGSELSEKRQLSAKALPERPDRKLIRWARRKVGCGLLPERVAPAPAAKLTQKQLLASYRAAKAQVTQNWEATWRRKNSGDAALLDLRTRQAAADAAAAKAKAAREAAAATEEARVAEARRDEAARQAKAERLRALEARAKKARPWMLTVKNLDLARAMAEAARGDQTFDFRLRDGSTVAMRVDQAEALPEVSRVFDQAIEKKTTYFHLRMAAPNLAPGLVLATARQDRKLLEKMSSQTLGRSLSRLPEDLASSARSILARRGAADAARRAENEAWNKSRIEKGIRDGWLKRSY